MARKKKKKKEEPDYRIHYGEPLTPKEEEEAKKKVLEAQRRHRNTLRPSKRHMIKR